METYITYLIYLHAFFGGIGLISGLSILFIKKGSKTHRILGRIFSIGMLLSSIISIPICMLPKHENLFLALIALFTIYLIITGNRALKFKNKKAQKLDYFVSYMMMSISITMLLIGIFGLFKGVNGYILYVFFGVLGLRLSLGDLKFYKKPKLWLRNHISKMLGALIASVTAFIIAGLQINNVIAWVLPSVIGTFYIYYWVKKIRK